MILIYDLNKVEDARAYLLDMESRGKLEFDDGAKVSALTDDEVVEAACVIFLRLNPSQGEVEQ